MKIYQYGQPCLHKKTKPVTEFDKTLIDITDRMYNLMLKVNGIGIAANQVGISKNFAVIDIENGKNRIDVINPKIIAYSQETIDDYEGCLSIPEIHEVVKRYSKVTVEALNLYGNPIQFEASGLLARVLQHEIDHLNGLVFIDRLEHKIQTKLFKKKLAKLKK